MELLCRQLQHRRIAISQRRTSRIVGDPAHRSPQRGGTAAFAPARFEFTHHAIAHADVGLAANHVDQRASEFTLIGEIPHALTRNRW